jgi:hypothetical protein
MLWRPCRLLSRRDDAIVRRQGWRGRRFGGEASLSRSPAAGAAAAAAAAICGGDPADVSGGAPHHQLAAVKSGPRKPYDLRARSSASATGCIATTSPQSTAQLSTARRTRAARRAHLTAAHRPQRIGSSVTQPPGALATPQDCATPSAGRGHGRHTQPVGGRRCRRRAVSRRCSAAAAAARRAGARARATRHCGGLPLRGVELPVGRVRRGDAAG